MRKITALFLVLFCHYCFAQKNDAQWELSYNTSLLDFRADTIALHTVPGLMPMVLTNANICDTSGNLLYFTNGEYIADRNGNKLLNGDTLSPCYYTDLYYPNGLNIQQAALFLPKPGSTRYYYLLHFSGDTLNRPNTLYYSLIDNEGNGGFGSVIEKNVPFLKLTGTNVLRGGGITACKHANGRDYWIVMGGSNNNEFYKFLLSPTGISGPYIQYIGPIFSEPYDNAYSKFSQDGGKYVTSCIVGAVLVMDFDRCSGEFSNAISIFHYAGTDSGQSISGAMSEEFSPNGRFLYVNNITDLTQYDLLADTIQDSVELYVSDTSDFYGLDMLQYAPNGKVYCSTFDGGLKALHVINYPDLKGDSCKFIYGGQPTLTLNSCSVPNMINYNLGSLVNSGCDTIKTGVATVSANNLLRVLPNPADKYLYAEMGMQSSYEFELLNEAGQVVDRKQTRQVDNFGTERLADGIYILRATDKSTNGIFTRKIIVQH